MLVMQKWQITNYRLSQASGIMETTVGKLINGELETTSWDNVEKLAAGFEQINPLANGAFLKALQLPDGRYPGLDNVIEMFWDRELPENIAVVMAVLKEYKLLNQDNLKKLKAKLAENDSATEAITPTTIEEFISSKMVQKRRRKGGSSQNA